MSIIYRPILSRLDKTLSQQNYMLQQLKAQNIRNNNDIYILKYRHIQNDILGNILFYMPYLLFDYIQNDIVFQDRFHEIGGLEELDTYIPDNAVILDIGANIGNHTLYWGVFRNVKKIHAFEPMIKTYEVLQKNIILNKLEQKVQLYNIALGSTKTKGSVRKGQTFNTMFTHIEVSEQGKLEIDSLDNIVAQGDFEKIDFIKIDVEQFELQVLLGAVETLKKYKPSIYVEILYRSPENKKEILPLLNDLGYIFKTFINNEAGTEETYLFVHKDKINN